MHPIKVLQKILAITLYPFRVCWSALFYPLALSGMRFRGITKKYHICTKRDNPEHFVLYIHGYAQFGFTEFSASDDTTQLEVILPDTYQSILSPYSFKSHADRLHERIEEINSSHPNAQITVVGFSFGGATAMQYYLSRPQKDNVQVIVYNTFSSLYKALCEFPAVLFFVFSIHCLPIGIGLLINYATQGLVLSKGGSLGIAFLSIFLAGHLCAGLMYYSETALPKERINAFVSQRISSSVQQLIHTLLELLNPLKSQTKCGPLFYTVTLPLRSIISVVLAAVAIILSVLIITEEIIFAIPKPFTYFVLWVMDCHTNFAAKLRNRMGRLIQPNHPLKIIQSTDDERIYSDARLSEALKGTAAEIKEITGKHEIQRDISATIQIAQGG